MSKKAFDKIAEGLNEALAIAQGAADPAKLHVPAEMDVRAIRLKAQMSQDQFASAFGFTVHQVRQWEQGRHRPLGAMRAYLMVIDRNHKEVLALLSGSPDRKAA
ncbi:DNA-binding transcriptional regulator [Acidisphaera sp. S103]|uniref:helix-turn-helix domain-containing protein n=1 Tax=Acidisphaera sp. S103 TaxID=1747223 RepID=UPI00131DD36F|nr:helix-turn-helix domain-containing protein [Acidisphaera sp. S103]